MTWDPEDFHQNQHYHHPHVVENKTKNERRPPNMFSTFLLFAILVPIVLPFAFSIANWVSIKAKPPQQIANEIGEEKFQSGVWGACVGLIVVGLLSVFKAFGKRRY
jgi:hypothetical protein